MEIDFQIDRGVELSADGEGLEGYATATPDNSLTDEQIAAVVDLIKKNKMKGLDGGDLELTEAWFDKGRNNFFVEAYDYSDYRRSEHSDAVNHLSWQLERILEEAIEEVFK